MSTVSTVRRVGSLLAALAMLSFVVVLPSAEADLAEHAQPASSEVHIHPENPEMTLIEVDDPSSLSRLASLGFDLDHWVEPTENDTVQSIAFTTSEERDALADLGVTIIESNPTPEQDEVRAQLMGEVDGLEVLEAAKERMVEASDSSDLSRPRTGPGKTPPVDEDTTLRVLRADTFTNYAGDFISLEIRSMLGASDTVTATYVDGGETITRTLNVFNDGGQYMYHRLSRPVLVDGTPEEVTLTSGDGTSVTVPTSPWASYDTMGYPDGFQWGFITTGYPDAVDSTNKIEALAAEFPDLAEIIELPNQSNGYRRPAMLTASVPGQGQSDQYEPIAVRSHAYGHEGGNDLTFAVVDPDEENAELAVSVDGNDITVSQSTNADGAVTGTAAEIVELINEDDAASELIYAHLYRNNDGARLVRPDERQELSDFLTAPEDKISREPQTIKAIRIGKHRDGSRVGVLSYSQEHAREWVTPVVALEAAERLLRNYGSDPATTRYVDDLDIFIVPVVNPDGANYSLYDNATQRKNFSNWCPDSISDSGYRNSWGVDLNRNFRVGNLFQGYSGASTSCTSQTFAGPYAQSEPEARNTVWLVENFDNIRFSMNVHTHGGYFMWAPGAYSQPGRVPLPRPTLGTENFFFAASDTILAKIAEHRGTVVEPGRTGPIIDVLYSAAGNSADDFFYTSLERGAPIYGWTFEAGANRYTGQGSTGWQSPGGFFPDWATEGFDQSMEFASGIYGILEVAHQFHADRTPPTSTPNLTPGGYYTGSVDVFWDLDEPADIYYTIDGSRPTMDSPMVDRRDARDGAAPVRIEESTQLRWFAVDAAGNVEDEQRLTLRIRHDAPTVPTRPTAARR